MGKTKVIDPGWTWDDNMPLAQAIRAGDFIFLSGQIALNESGDIVGPGNLEAQSRQIFENIKSILDLVGADFSNIVRLTNYFVRSVQNPEAFWAIRKEYFGDTKPASTGVQVDGLLYPDLLLEVDVVIYLPETNK